MLPIYQLSLKRHRRCRAHTPHSHDDYVSGGFDMIAFILPLAAFAIGLISLMISYTAALLDTLHLYEKCCMDTCLPA